MFSHILLAFTLVTLILSFVYFYMFSRRQERFMQYWGFSWVAYSCSLLCLIIFINTNHDFLLELRKVIDMFNLMLLLFGVFAFMHTRTPAYWYRFSLYMVLLAGICTIYKFDLLSFYLPINIYQIFITLAICYNIFRYWNMEKVEKGIAVIVFFVWGIGKALLSIFELYYTPIYNLYITEIILSNLLNFCILTIYIQNTRREIALTQHLYKTVVEHATDAIFYYRLTPNPSFEYVTPSIGTLTGYAPQKFYEDPRFYINLVTSKYLDEIEDVFNGKIQHEGGHIFEITAKSGDTFWGEINSSVISDERGKPIAVEGILRDITEMKSAQLQQIQAKKSRDLLLSYISHELRTPVTSIAGYLTALSDGVLRAEDEKKEAMEIITSKTLLLKTLIDDLDQLSKLETHQFSFNFMSCTVIELSDYLLYENLPEIQRAGFSPVVHYDKETLQDLEVIADQARISQVFSNLITNAIKYSNHFGEIDLTFTIDPVQEAYVVTVKDHGIGIAKKDLPHIFDQFYRVTAVSPELEQSGRGLGLTLAREIVEAHDGQLTVSSQPGKGSDFTFTIPLFKEVQDGTGKNTNR